MMFFSYSRFLLPVEDEGIFLRYGHGVFILRGIRAMARHDDYPAMDIYYPWVPVANLP
jgi:hypothetical protein